MNLRLLQSILSLLLICLPLAGAESHTLRFAHPDPAMTENPHHIMVVEAQRLIDERSKGRIKVDIYPSKQLGTDTDTVFQIQGDILEAAIVYPQSMVTFVPEIQVMGIPYLFNVVGYDADELISEVMKGPLADRLGEELTSKFDNVQLISLYGNHWRDFATTFPLKTIEDMKGRRIRTIPSPIQQSFISNLGGVPTIVDSSEVFTALGTGLIDGADYGVMHLYSIRIVDFIKYVYVDHHVPIICYIVANRGWLDRLPSDLRIIVVDSLKDAAEFGTRNASEINRVRSIQFEEIHGGTIYHPAGEELKPFRMAAEPIKDFYARKYGNEWLEITASAVEEAKRQIDERKHL